ncbi:transglutaminase family protein [Mucilaginibacter ximonensis]|uniref:Transglutaminase family protein n=1 Tax=Mucilaginibacter ximonensis TaxID=538021 RepID=A0ABW5Y6S7_9SPHI
MKFKVSTDMEYEVRSASTLILSIHALNTSHQTVLSEQFSIIPNTGPTDIVTTGENRLWRLDIKEPGTYKIHYEALVDNFARTVDYSDDKELSLAELDPAVLPYLNPSRYCQCDKLHNFAHNLFGDIKTPFKQVTALTDWIHQNVKYLSGSSSTETSAFDTVTEQQGVCRDFAHVGIALCRALNIPARYFTGYAYQLNPPDFHACFEAYLHGEWILFDATKLVPLNGMVKIATGLDAAEAAIANIFGDTSLTAIATACELADEGFEPIIYSDSITGIVYL